MIKSRWIDDRGSENQHNMALDSYKAEKHRVGRIGAFWTLLTTTFFLPAVLLCLAPPSAIAATATCPCTNPAWCAPVRTGPRPEVFGFSVTSGTGWKGYHFDIITTIAWNEDPQLMCLAHSKGVRVVLNVRVEHVATRKVVEASDEPLTYSCAALDVFRDRRHPLE